VTPPQALSNLDLHEVTGLGSIKHDLRAVTESMEKRLAMYGSIECMQRVARKTGGNRSCP
jgi:hypothetical protein